jgi:ribonuclease P protein subunit POP4
MSKFLTEFASKLTGLPSDSEKLSNKVLTLSKTNIKRKKGKKDFKSCKSEIKNLKYSECIKMNDLWCKYIEEINQKDPSFLLKADLHGCIIKVISSKCPSFVGIEGLIVMELKNIFYILTRENLIKGILFCFLY